MKYLILRFEGAGLFTNHKATKDKMIIKRKNGVVDRTNKNFKEPITVYQISNVIHCLFGERPVPTFRNVFYKPINYYFDKAKNSFLKISNYKSYNKNKDTYQFYREKTSTKKAVWNSWCKQIDMNWFKIKKYLTNGEDNSLYEFFINESNKLFNCDVTNISVKELKKKFLLNSDNCLYIINHLKQNEKTVLSDFLSKEDYDGFHLNANYSRNINRTINNGIDDISKLNGYIYIPVNDNDIERLKKVSTGTCTILDGGVVYIESIKESYELQNDDFIKVCDISIDKIETLKKEENEIKN